MRCLDAGTALSFSPCVSQSIAQSVLPRQDNEVMGSSRNLPMHALWTLFKNQCRMQKVLFRLGQTDALFLWKPVHQFSFHCAGHESRGLYQPLSKADAEARIRNEALGLCHVRLLPKSAAELRPISNLSRKPPRFSNKVSPEASWERQ